MDRRQVEVWRHIEPSRTNEPGRVIDYRLYCGSPALVAGEGNIVTIGQAVPDGARVLSKSLSTGTKTKKTR